MSEDQSRQYQNSLVPASAAVRRGFEAVVPNPKLRLMDQVREVLRLKHYAIRTESCYCDWIRRYIRFHRMQSRAELVPGTAKVEEFLSDLAVNGHVAASTQNQAFNALLFLYREVLHEPFENVQAVRADRPVRVPVVFLRCWMFRSWSPFHLSPTPRPQSRTGVSPVFPPKSPISNLKSPRLARLQP